MVGIYCLSYIIMIGYFVLDLRGFVSRYDLGWFLLRDHKIRVEDDLHINFCIRFDLLRSVYLLVGLFVNIDLFYNVLRVFH